MTHGPRAAFTIIEALVATAMLGVAGASLAATLTVVATVQNRAALRAATAAAGGRRLNALVRRPCTAPDTAGADAAGPVLDAWTARRTGGSWVFADTLRAPGAPAAVIGGTVPCRR
jgi:type II secretory pathway pseudopilin PulG